MLFKLILLSKVIDSNYRYNQKKLRIECYQGIVDHVARSAFNNSNNFNELERLVFVLSTEKISSRNNV